MRKLRLLEEVTHQGHPGMVDHGGAGPRFRRVGVGSGFSTPPLPTCHPHGTLAPLGTCFPALNLGVLTVPSSRGYFKDELTAVRLSNLASNPAILLLMQTQRHICLCAQEGSLGSKLGGTLHMTGTF